MSETEIKWLKMSELYTEVVALGIPELRYFDFDSEKLLDEKIEVFTQLKEGKNIGEIPNFYNILELMPKSGIWD